MEEVVMNDKRRDKLTIGFIGLGNMGYPMAARLIESGFSLLVFDIENKILKKIVHEHGCQSANSLSELGEMSGIIITMLPDGEVVRRVVLGQENNDSGTDRLLDYMREGTILIDMSSSSPSGTQELGKILETKGISFIDAPVSGGVKGAIEGTLSIMVGGDPATTKICKPLFDVIGKQAKQSRIGRRSYCDC
jgi:3-hydroxyisobutyrate dehydrogenase